ncbi:MAG: peptide ABC transporter substrate-binding protein [Gemmatimonadota bacterium]|nr:peptide ABC transporter substrate-binding protein [Gemmatimonadota bacterium]
MRIAGLVLLLLASATPAGAQPRAPDTGTIVIVVGQEATTPIPTIPATKANGDIMSLLFLKLARLDGSRGTVGDRGYTPELAVRWSRRDSLTIAFELDPRARWHDGRPVLPRDVVHTFARVRQPGVDPQVRLLARHIASVTAEGDRGVVVRFTLSYPEQYYDAIENLVPLPSHLVDTIPANRIASSAFAQAPLGNGPYRWVRREPGRQVELAADPNFFLGRPKLERVIFLLARDYEAQINLLLDGTADALENVNPPARIARVNARPSYRVVAGPSYGVGYLLFNFKAYGDSTQPHPILADPAVRTAIITGLDRSLILRSTLGPYGSIPEGPVAQLHWIRDPGWSAPKADPVGAAARLRQAGWIDSNGDGILDRNGVPLILRLNYPGTNAVRATMAAQVQEQLRHLGVRIELVRLDGPVWLARRETGEFDLDFSQAVMTPSPTGLVQSWSCGGMSGSNVGRYCNPRIDSLLLAAALGRTDPGPLYREVLRQIRVDAPAVFLFTVSNATAVHTRFQNVQFRPEAWWSLLWKWSVRPGAQIARDRGVSR